MLTEFEAHQISIAGICGATTAFAKAGLFRIRRHTSNGKEFLLEHVPGYEDPALYADMLAVRDKGVISANGLGAVEFAREIFAELGVFTDTDLQLFEKMYRHGQVT